MSPRLLRITLAGAELEGFAVDLPAASVRLLLPSPGVGAARDAGVERQRVPPAGREPSGDPDVHAAPRRSRRARARPRHRRARSGAASQWAEAAAAGAEAAVSGPGRGYTIDADAPAFVLAGDETAIPAMSQLLEVLPAATPVQVYVEIAAPEARFDLAAPSARDGRLARARGWRAGRRRACSPRSRDAEIVPDAGSWVAGEAAGVQRIRRHLFEERGLTRAQATVRGYWKHGRAGTDDDA